MIPLAAFALASVITFAIGLKLNENYSTGVSTVLDMFVFSVTFYYSYKFLEYLRNG